MIWSNTAYSFSIDKVMCLFAVWKQKKQSMNLWMQDDYLVESLDYRYLSAGEVHSKWWTEKPDNPGFVFW